MSDRWTIGPLSFETIEDAQQPAPVISKALAMRIDRKGRDFDRIEVDLTGFDHEIKGDTLVLTPKPLDAADPTLISDAIARGQS